MEQLISAFGIDVKLIIIQIVNFAILMAILTYFLYRPVISLLEKRRQIIAKGLSDAKVAAEAKFAAERSKQILLNKANNQADKIVDKAKGQAEKKSEAIIEQANQKASGILKTANDRCENLKHKTIKESQSEIAKLVVLATEKMIRDKN